MNYPHAPGSKAAGTSEEAARSVDAETLRAEVLRSLAGREMTADETAAAMGRNILSIRPRFSELRKLGQISDTTERRPNASGKRATVWRAN